MSYRTYVNDVQVFGNGEYYDEWFEFLETQGIVVDEEGVYKGEIKDFMGAIVAIEKIVMRLNQKREEHIASCGGHIGKHKILPLFDFTNYINRISNQAKDEKMGFSILDELFDITEMTYAFMPYAFYKACEEMLEETDSYLIPNHFRCFKIKEGCSIVVEAF